MFSCCFNFSKYNKFHEFPLANETCVLVWPGTHPTNRSPGNEPSVRVNRLNIVVNTIISVTIDRKAREKAKKQETPKRKRAGKVVKSVPSVRMEHRTIVFALILFSPEPAGVCLFIIMILHMLDMGRTWSGDNPAGYRAVRYPAHASCSGRKRNRIMTMTTNKI